jgi:hypothetical protein
MSVRLNSTLLVITIFLGAVSIGYGLFLIWNVLLWIYAGLLLIGIAVFQLIASSLPRDRFEK